MDVTLLRRRLASEFAALPYEEAFALLGELLVFVCLDGKMTVDEFDAKVLQPMKKLYADCKDRSEDVVH
jgi:hypothetical protein